MLSHRPIVHYTLLLLLFTVGAYKGVSLSLLSATLVGELSNVPFLVGKLQRIAGVNEGRCGLRVTKTGPSYPCDVF